MLNNQDYAYDVEERLIFATEKVTYYSCRAPDGGCEFVARCADNQLADNLGQLLYRYNLCIGPAYECNQRNACRACQRINFIPFVSSDHNAMSGRELHLNYYCFDFGQFVRAIDLSEIYNLSPQCAYRLAIGLFIFAYQLIRLNIEVKIELENLFIDLESMSVTLIDWSEANPVKTLGLPWMSYFYRQAAKIVLQLVGAVKDGDTWRVAGKLGDSENESKVLDFLLELAQQEFGPFTQLDRATDAAISLHKKQQNVLQDFLKLLTKTGFAKHTAYELIPKIKEG